MMASAPRSGSAMRRRWRNAAAADQPVPQNDHAAATGGEVPSAPHRGGRDELPVGQRPLERGAVRLGDGVEPLVAGLVPLVVEQLWRPVLGAGAQEAEF